MPLKPVTADVSVVLVLTNSITPKVNNCRAGLYIFF